MGMEQTRRAQGLVCGPGNLPNAAAGALKGAVGMRSAMKVSKVAFAACMGLAPL